MSTPTLPPRPKFYLPQLDGLRFLAFIMVFLHHFEPSENYFPRGFCERNFAIFQRFGWVGVDIFLTLSAFLIFTLLLAERASTGTVRIRLFYLRRALRIWPLYYVYLAIAFLLPCLTEPGYNLLVTTRQHLAPAMGFLLNFSLIQFYQTIPFTLAHLWTISLEEQFYLFAPLAVFFFAKARSRTLALIILGLFVVTIAARAYEFLNSPPYLAAWVSPLCRLDPLLVGATLAFAHHRHPAFFTRWRGEWFAIAAIALFVLITRFPQVRSSPHTVWQLSADALGCGCLIIAVVGRGRVARIFRCQPLPYLGKISFGLYLYHEICLHYGPVVFSNYTLVKTPLHWLAGLMATLLSTIALGTGSYFLYERHFLKLKRRFEIVPARPA